MTFEAMANIIRSRFKNQVVGATGLLVAYDNAPFDEPDNAVWVRFTVLTGDSDQASFGAQKRFRTIGIAVAQIFQPIMQGDKASLALADRIVTAFRSVTDSGVVFKTPSLRRVGRTEKFNQINVSCPFYADDVQGA